ncbi:MFS transporter [Paraburkholderia hospita]|jgi:MFS family permease|uniref:MFS transporter n=1 Tax=Paraburkholderia hospita TaxID=169430 RepID=A0AAN1ML86_9BURK|nr:MFS transporter [Paraburkholderia hospita]AUT71216.1 MFS transporter [Paraburkholderia hospita]SEI26858.1 Predicted arabinose efflux permease, MFS family [Paraburkholderia hospita]
MPTVSQSAQHASTRHNQFQIAATVVIANAIEFFDYFSYATFITFINRCFFPSSLGASSSIFSFGVFAAGFLARPLGAILIGRHADTTGRKPAFLLTALLVTIGTLGIAVVPSYSTLGLLAPLLVLFARFIQGLAIGAELGVSASLLLEICIPKSRSTCAGWLMAGQGLALVASGLCGIAILHTVPPGALETWGWRIPFVLASAMFPLQMYLRRRIPEDQIDPAESSPSRTVLLGLRKQWLLAIVFIFGGTVPTYMATYTATFGVGNVMPTHGFTAVATVAVGLTSVVMSVVGGWLSDRLGRTPIIAFARLSTVLVALPAFHVAEIFRHDVSLLAVIVLFSGLSALAGGPTIIEIILMFPRRHRALTLSLAYATGVALFGGTAPLVVASLDAWAGWRQSAAWYLMVSGAASLLALTLNRVRNEH